MTDAAARALLGDDRSPAAGGLLRALWHGARGEWEAAHAIAQDDPSAAGAWVHAWLHRVEGDDANAAYWYRRAGRPIAAGPTEDEARAIAAALLGETGAG
ncbi:hypothetical protein K7957_15060 [Sphingomonas yunnanensis]|uniref:hypothetical protein n=1 Tax=Sphingomonas yunnanensis TaxID=310400 RepID=UPI001CA735BA|nr:hypothetical protein [Sphingomonas yunnanensis]MBY9064259.1 hypothetical protein [Sphingomonas yunnanensis]